MIQNYPVLLRGVHTVFALSFHKFIARIKCVHLIVYLLFYFLENKFRYHLHNRDFFFAQFLPSRIFCENEIRWFLLGESETLK